MSSMEALNFKLNQQRADNNILMKELEQLKRDYGELLIANSSAQHELTESSNELQALRNELAVANHKLQASNDELEAKVLVFTNEIRMLKKQKHELCEESRGFEEKKAKYEEELRGLRRKCEELERKAARLEKEKEEIRKEEREESSRVSEKKKKLERDLNVVTTLVLERFRVFERRLAELERGVADLNHDSSKSGSQLIDETQVQHEHGSFRPETNLEGLVGDQCNETPPNEEKTASSMSAILKSPIDLTRSDDDDDDADVPIPKGHKRKISSSECSFKVEDGDSFSGYWSKEKNDLSQESMNPSKKTLPALNPGQQKFIKWEYEADLLDDLQKDTELCMKGVCALYRQKMLCTPRETSVAKYLTDGDAKKELKKTLADLENDPKAAHDCRRIALSYPKQLFDIYKNGKDPLFAHDITSSQKTRM